SGRNSLPKALRLVYEFKIMNFLTWLNRPDKRAKSLLDRRIDCLRCPGSLDDTEIIWIVLRLAEHG
ncbi:MAG TPA: hypothetical protein PLA50_15020, partial [Bacteroidia bacterium]|nr:hypothetical protein [Bacteroidia bacterium]